MRRIYESQALSRDDDDPFVPGNEDDKDRYRSINWDNASHAFVPKAVRSLAIDVSIETNRQRYAAGEPVGFRVEFRNRLPIPISLTTPTPVRWTWAIDGVEEASYFEESAPEESSTFRFARAERKRFGREWTQRFRMSSTEWELAEPGEHTISVAINAKHGADRLTDSVTFFIEE